MNLEKILQNDKRIWDEDILDYPQLFELARTYDKELLETLFNNKESKKKFFIQVGDSHVFKYNEFRFYLEENQVNNSFTQYANKIGLASQGEHLSDSTDYVLDWPYKDCVLEGGMSSEEDMDTFIEKKVETTPGKIDKKTGTVISTEKTEVTFSQAKRKREEIFYNNIIADKEIDRLLDKKALKNFTRYTAKGEEKVKEIKRDEDGTIKENLLIKGNNLLALHSLKEQFAGKVKLIYIDPPYNTGNDGFVYNDRFNHSTWLTFMKNRLEIAKEFLREDGVIFVQCDDNEQANLKVIMDQIFEKDNFLGTIITRATPNGRDYGHIARTHEYIHFYSKNLENTITYEVKSEDKKFKYIDDKGGYNLHPLYNSNVKFNKNNRKNLFYPFYLDTSKENKEGFYNISLEKENKNFIEVLPPKSLKENIQFVWRWGKEKSSQNLNTEIIGYKNNDGTFRIVQKMRNETQLTRSLWVEKEVSNRRGTEELQKIFGNKIFSYPKPEKLILNILAMSTAPNDIIMDFHLGSGTTAAVAHKMKRQYIGIEQIDYISDVSVPRIIEVLKAEQGGISKEVNWKGGGDFIYFELAEYNEEAKNKIDACKSFKELKKLFTELTEYYFLNYNVSVKQFNDQLLDDKDFQELPLEEQKTLFNALLDNNQLYIPHKEQEDSKYNLSKEDQELTNEFYG